MSQFGFFLSLYDHLVDFIIVTHGLRTPSEEIAFNARPKIHSHSQIFRYGRSIFCLPHRPKFSDFFDLCLHWVSVLRGYWYSNVKNFKSLTWFRQYHGLQTSNEGIIQKKKKIWKFGPMWQTKYTLAVLKNLGMGVDCLPYSYDNFLTWPPQYVGNTIINGEFLGSFFKGIFLQF